MVLRSIVHIGFHKTGSTSIQAFCWKFRHRLAGLGIAMYEGAHFRSNHTELHVAAMRPERMTPFKIKAGIAGGSAYRLEIEQRLARIVSSTPQDTLLFSAEGLSYLREQEELDWLRSVLPGKAAIVAYLREPQEFLHSYRHALIARGISPSSETDSFAYTGEDSWLIDYNERLKPFRASFGAQNVISIDYGKEVANCGTVIPSFLRILGAESHFCEQEWSAFFLNRRLRLSECSATGQA
ncbi:MAG: hypothetical protein L0Y57_05300 [Beijerinckiaceae bacterium]|nr:hypothetical protein [Beijerinckiaceae bacterium]